MKLTFYPLIVGLSLLGGVGASADPEGSVPAESNQNHITEVTLYQGTALVTRQVTLPAERAGAFEVIVKGLPTATDAESVFADEGRGLEIRSVTCRQRSSEETKRVESEVARLDERIKELERAISTARNEIALRRIRQEFLRDLGSFVAPAARQEMTHGVLQAGELEKVTQMHFREYETASQEIMELDNAIADDSDELTGLREERHRLAEGPTEIYDAVIFVEKEAGAEAVFDLNYLVRDCGWSPVYNVAGVSGGEEVRLEFNALIHQVSGEDWRDAGLILSTASPTVSAQNPELTALHVEVQQSGVLPSGNDSAMAQAAHYQDVLRAKNAANRKVLAGKTVKDFADANFAANELAASAQLVELSMRSGQFKQLNQTQDGGEDLAIQYELDRAVTLVSRREAQMVRVLAVNCPASFYHVATPVLTSAVFREAELVNTGSHDLLGGKVHVYLDDKFIGRTEMPTIARGRSYTLGFGVDGQLRARRTLVDRTETVQGGNRLVEIEVEVVLDNFKEEPVTLSVRERTPHMEDTASLRVSLSESSHPLSTDRDYLRFERPKGILRWDLAVAPGTGEQATAINYTYRLEYDKSVSLQEVSGERKSVLRNEFIQRAGRSQKP
ncbi:mucoidy inhibitor MuiA family protein [Roseibacillus ishigakijimensis]|uniref:Mucoidy inhibitor MuiA family protein n=1 Tax=Roseibacillus ishigakijimensis TaxID=454146 RepID=A0A934RRC4_9BACT|nr:mucoidy inhibitor MuiA family protein [Roseibacillus ishigakijimensis]MBK1834043.1 mucoidy inhibitor MuiA family protein [Roseibacillus ishigakijimensis]